MEKNHCKLQIGMYRISQMRHTARLKNAAKKYSGSGGIRAGEGDAAAQAGAGDDADAENISELAKCFTVRAQLSQRHRAITHAS